MAGEAENLCWWHLQTFKLRECLRSVPSPAHMFRGWMNPFLVAKSSITEHTGLISLIISASWHCRRYKSGECVCVSGSENSKQTHQQYPPSGVIDSPQSAASFFPIMHRRFACKICPYSKANIQQRKAFTGWMNCQKSCYCCCCPLLFLLHRGRIKTKQNKIKIKFVWNTNKIVLTFLRKLRAHKHRQALSILGKKGNSHVAPSSPLITLIWLIIWPVHKEQENNKNQQQ